MKKGIIVILLLLVIACGGFIIYYLYDSREVNQNENNQISNINTNTNVGDSINNIDIEKNTTNNQLNSSQEDTNDDGTFIVRNVKSEDYNSYYQTMEVPEAAEDCINIEKKENTLVLNVIDSETNEMLFERGSKVSLDEKYTISNVNANDVKFIFYGVEGQDIGYPLVFLLLNDGTVKGVDIQSGYQNGNFIAKNISGLKDISKFEQVDVTPPNDSGYVGVVAISQDDTIYSIQHK